MKGGREELRERDDEAVRKLEEGQMEEGRGDIYKWNFLATVHCTCKLDLALGSCAP